MTFNSSQIYCYIGTFCNENTCILILWNTLYPIKHNGGVRIYYKIGLFIWIRIKNQWWHRFYFMLIADIYYIHLLFVHEKIHNLVKVQCSTDIAWTYVVDQRTLTITKFVNFKRKCDRKRYWYKHCFTKSNFPWELP